MSFCRRSLDFFRGFFGGGRQKGAAAKACDGNGEEVWVFHTEQRVDVTFELRVVPADARLHDAEYKRLMVME